jgi:hypothetical protein
MMWFIIAARVRGRRMARRSASMLAVIYPLVRRDAMVRDVQARQMRSHLTGPWCVVRGGSSGDFHLMNDAGFGIW